MMTTSVLFSGLGLLVTIMLAMFSMVFKRLNTMDERLRKAPSREEMRAHVQDKLEVHSVQLQEIKDDLKDVGHKLDKLIEKTSK